MERIGIIGLGRMGSAMAARLAGQGLRVTGWTRSGLSFDRAAELEVAPADTLADLADASDIILTSLFDDAAVGTVLTDLASCDLTGKLLIETSTVSPEIVKRHAPTFPAALLDAPISGGPEMVASATCGIFIGGAAADVTRAMPVLEAMSGSRVHVGPLGAGMTMKAIVNAQLNVYFAGLSDTIAMARAADIPFETAITILANSPSAMPMLKARLPRLLGQDDSVGFSPAGARKDVQVFIAMAEDLGLDVPALHAAVGAWDRMAGDPEAQDVTALIVQSYDRAHDRG